MLTKGNFTRDEWRHLLRLFNISIFSSASCPQTMWKRIQEGTGKEINMAKSRPTLNLVSKTVASSATAQSSSASNGPGMLKAPGQSLSLIACGRRLRALKCGNQMQRRTQARTDLLLQRQSRIWTFKQVRGDLRLKGQVSSTLTQCGQTFSRYLLLASHILRKSTRIYDRKLVANQETT